MKIGAVGFGNRTAHVFFELKKIGRLGKQISKIISSPKLE